MTHFPTLSYTLASEISTLLYTWSLKRAILSRGASPYRWLCGVPPGYKAPLGAHSWPPEWTLLSYAHARLCIDVQKIERVHFHPVGSQRIKILLITNLKKKTFSSLKNSVHVEPVWFSLNNLSLCAALTTAQWYCTRLKKISDALKLFSYEREDFFIVFLKYRDKLSTKHKKFR